MGVPVNPYPPTPSSLSLLLWNKSAWIQENGMNRCSTYYPLSSHLYAFLWWLYVLLLNLLTQIICSDQVIVFYICYHAGGSTKRFGWPKVNRRDEESSPSDALTLKKRKTRLAGKMRRSLNPEETKNSFSRLSEDISMGVPAPPHPPTPSSLSLLL